MLEAAARRFRDVLPAGLDAASLRLVREHSEHLVVRNGVLQPHLDVIDQGAMVRVVAGRGEGWAATSDLSGAGLRDAIDRARSWAERCAAVSLFDASAVPRLGEGGRWTAPVGRSWWALSLADRVDRVRAAGEAFGGADGVVEFTSGVLAIRAQTLRIDTDGGEVSQLAELVAPELNVVAARAGLSQRRSLGGGANARQGGVEQLEAVGYFTRAGALQAEALALLDAPECPVERCELVLSPDQMTLQIHESIGHPLELDRILGDERNYAGTSFVRPEMFGSFQYGSALLNVRFDPGLPGEFACYGFDDEGSPASPEWIIKDGILLRPLGGARSQHRAGMAGVAGARASSWNRPPIDRMANLNVAPGHGSVADVIAGVERGVWMEANRSWSIDDSRNKFQFGCELGRVIENGELKGLVRNPNYRGVSSAFWRGLSAVGGPETVGVHGTPYCGKGEPNQIIRVGHASPVCRFSGVEVFGGA